MPLLALPERAPAVRSTGASPVATWLLGRGDLPPAEELRAANLGAYAYTALAEDHPERVRLRLDFMSSVARSLCHKRTMLPLLDAWQRAGIPVLLFKGFHLSEFLYPVRGARAFADVDVLLRPESADAARRVAEREGWGVDYDSGEVGQPHFHTAFELIHPTTGVWVDVHRYALGAMTPGLRLKRRVTDAVWARARERDWEGVRVWEMDPVDALLVGLVLGRAWGADGWAVKAHDAVDWRLLREQAGTGDAQLERRARELGCARTLQLFRERFDPDGGRLELGRPSRGWVRRARALSMAECFQLGATLLRATSAPGIAADVAATLPYVYRAVRAVRRLPDLRELLPSLTPPAGGAAASGPAVGRRFRTSRGVRWAARLLRTASGCDGLVRSLALYAALREQGWAVSFVSGVPREGGRATSHAWLELDGRVLPELREFTNGDLYREDFRYP
ncbi:MAG TPA: lasso peptide biosynthesis B2 protein [Longimicrobium sp.]|nr:lasso peptide biosynthesis B2 protein [Longimicrobium sp.]